MYVPDYIFLSFSKRFSYDYSGSSIKCIKSEIPAFNKVLWILIYSREFDLLIKYIAIMEQKEALRKIRDDPENTLCFDCGNIDITFTSISLGILLCAGCASVHRYLIPEISEIKPLESQYTQKQLQLLAMGGNASLKSFLAMYSIPCNDSIEYKYRTKACRYYKEMLEMMASGKECTMLTPSESEGAELADEYINKGFSSERTSKTEKLNIQKSHTIGEEELKENHPSRFMTAIRSVEAFASEAYNVVGDSVKEKTERGINFFRNKFRRSSEKTPSVEH